MTSKTKEDVHMTLLEKLLSDSGLECLQTPVHSVSSEEEEYDYEEGEGEVEEEASHLELSLELESVTPVLEEVGEELSGVFPSPSLRRLIPEKLRKIEAQNRIHVLPFTIGNTEIDPEMIPRINSTARQKYIDIIAELIGCNTYKNSLAEYWVIDTLANLLRRAQEDGLTRATQKALIYWFCEWMKEMQNFDAANKERMLRRWRDIMLIAAKFVGDENFLPFPHECDVYYKIPDEDVLRSTRTETTQRVGKMEESRDPDGGITMKLVWKASSYGLAGHDFDCSLRDLIKITHYIYDLFGTDYQYELIRSMFCHTPEYTQVDPPFQLQIPKRMYAALKPKSAKGKPKSPSKKDKDKGKAGKKKEPDTEEYIKLMEFIDKAMHQQDELEEKEREEWNKRSHILPLSFAATEELFNMYWPPVVPMKPPTPEVAEKKSNPAKKKK